MPRIWTEEDDQALIHRYDDLGMSPMQIADAMGRTIAAVANRLVKLRKDGKAGPARGTNAILKGREYKRRPEPRAPDEPDEYIPSWRRKRFLPG